MKQKILFHLYLSFVGCKTSRFQFVRITSRHQCSASDDDAPTQSSGRKLRCIVIHSRNLFGWCLSVHLNYFCLFQAAFYEIMCVMWVRNGLQIKGQAMTYIQCHFCNSMVDADMFNSVLPDLILLSVFLKSVLDRFHVLPWLSLSSEREQTGQRLLDQDQEIPIMESALIFLASLITLRTNLGLSEQDLARL